MQCLLDIFAVCWQQYSRIAFFVCTPQFTFLCPVTATVRVTLCSEASLKTGILLDPSTFTLTPTTWNTPVTVSVTAPVTPGVSNGGALRAGCACTFDVSFCKPSHS
jgi:hypothetical protein